MVIAIRRGLRESMIASISGMLCLNYYFLPPVGKWSIADSQNWVALFAFVVTASVASQLSASAARKAAEANHRQREMERLYVLSRSLLLMDARSPFAAQIAPHIADVCGFQNVVFYDRVADEVHTVSPAGASENTVSLPLQLGGKEIGTLTLPRASASET